MLETTVLKEEKPDTRLAANSVCASIAQQNRKLLIFYSSFRDQHPVTFPFVVDRNC